METLEKYLVENALDAKKLHDEFLEMKYNQAWKIPQNQITKTEILAVINSSNSRYNTLLKVIAEMKGYTFGDSILFVKNYGVFNA